MEPTSLTGYTQQHFYTIIAVQVVLGLVLGLIPLLLAIRKKRKSLGYVAMGTSLVLSLLSPILSLIAIVIFIILIVRKPAEPGESS
jgi:uncharacterized membrane protein YbhN (UPF0104 family)